MEVLRLVRCIGGLLTNGHRARAGHYAAPYLARHVRRSRVERVLRRAARNTLKERVAVDLVRSSCAVGRTGRVCSDLTVSIVTHQIIETTRPCRLNVLVTNVGSLLYEGLVILVRRRESVLRVISVDAGLVRAMYEDSNCRVVLTETARRAMGRISNLVQAVTRRGLIFDCPLSLARLLFRFRLR